MVFSGRRRNWHDRLKAGEALQCNPKVMDSPMIFEGILGKKEASSTTTDIFL